MSSLALACSELSAIVVSAVPPSEITAFLVAHLPLDGCVRPQT